MTASTRAQKGALHTATPSLACSLTGSLSHSLSHSLNHPLTHSPTHPPTHPHPATRPLSFPYHPTHLSQNLRSCVGSGGEERVADSPYELRVLPQHPVTRKCTVTGSGRSQATAGEPAEFYVEDRDQYGNR